MISAPSGFTLIPGVETLTLIPPGGMAAGVIHYQERMRPLCHLGLIVRRQLAAQPQFRALEQSPPERLVTLEGEHAALVQIAGSENGRSAVRYVSVIFGDDFYALTSALCMMPQGIDANPKAVREQWSELMRTLLVQDSLGLGTLRRRRYEYQPPEGWQPLTMGFVTDWIAPGFPREAAAITAFPAVPRQHSGGELFAMWLEQLESVGGVVLKRVPPVRCVTQSGLSGQLFAAVVQGKRVPLHRQLVVLEDARFSYVLALKVDGLDPAPYLSILMQTMHSIQAVPSESSGQRSIAWQWMN